MHRILSLTLASLWLAVAIIAACAGVASASADDSRLLPYGPAAHIWLLPKVGNRPPTEALVNPHAAKVIANALASASRGSERSSLRPQTRELSSIARAHMHRRLPPRRASGDPLAAA